MEAVSLWTWWCVVEVHVALIADSSSSVLLGLVCLFPLHNTTNSLKANGGKLYCVLKAVQWFFSLAQVRNFIVSGSGVSWHWEGDTWPYTEPLCLVALDAVALTSVHSLYSYNFFFSFIFWQCCTLKTVNSYLLRVSNNSLNRISHSLERDFW